jgi:hypothetical protein
MVAMATQFCKFPKLRELHPLHGCLLGLKMCRGKPVHTLVAAIRSCGSNFNHHRRDYNGGHLPLSVVHFPPEPAGVF